MNQVAFTDFPGGEPVTHGGFENVMQWSHSGTFSPRPTPDGGRRSLPHSGFPKLEAYKRATRPAERAIAAVRALKRYGTSWDGYGAEAPHPMSVRDAAEFLGRTRSDREFSIALGTDGLVTLVAGLGHAAVRLTFEGDTRVVVSSKPTGFWEESGVFDIRGRLGRTDLEVERLIGVP